MTKPICKHHNTFCGISESVALLDADPYDTHVIDAENALINDGLDKIALKLQRTLLRWPTCGNGGEVTMGMYIPDRGKKIIHGYWKCSCQDVKEEINEWDEDTLEMDS
jgi:hypothetical protein